MRFSNLEKERLWCSGGRFGSSVALGGGDGAARVLRGVSLGGKLFALYVELQKQKQSEEQFGKKLKRLQNELASSNESRQKLERKVSYLQNDNALLEIKQKELNDTVQSLLQSQEQFVNAYQESTYDMKRSIEAKDRKLKIFSEKLKSHLLLFDSIEKEALSVKQVVDNVRHVVTEKEEAVIGLKRKIDRLLEVEKVLHFYERITSAH